MYSVKMLGKQYSKEKSLTSISGSFQGFECGTLKITKHQNTATEKQANPVNRSAHGPVIHTETEPPN